MSNGDPYSSGYPPGPESGYPPAYTYENLLFPYEMPLDKRQQILRIPVAGPDPFNTLVVVRSIMTQGGLIMADNDLHRFPFVPMKTHFKLRGFDPLVYPPSSQPPHQHSTCVVVNWHQQDDDAAFVIAADEVAGHFDDEGNWTVLVSVAGQFDHETGLIIMNMSSWVLCYEPPPDPRLPKSAPFKLPNYLKLPRYFTPGGMSGVALAAGEGEKIAQPKRRSKRRK